MQFFVVFTMRRYVLRGLSYRKSVRQLVCLSVCHTRDCPHMVRPTIMVSSIDWDITAFVLWTPTFSIMVSSPYGSPIILVSADIRFIQKLGGHPERGRWMRLRQYVQIGDLTLVWPSLFVPPSRDNGGGGLARPLQTCANILGTGTYLFMLFVALVCS